MAKRPIPRTPLYSTARSVAYRSIPAPAAPATTQRVTNGNFSSATGWTPGAGWVIAAGVATNTLNATSLDNALSSAIAIGATVTYSITVNSNSGGDGMMFRLRNSGSLAQQLVSNMGDATGTFTGSIVANASGPYDQCRIENADGGGVVVIDDVSLIA